MSRAWPELGLIDEIVAGRYRAAETGRPLSTAIRRLVIAPSLAGGEKELLAGVGLRGRLALVADENTMPVLGERVARALGRPEVVLLERPRADAATARRLALRTRELDGLVAVGSGTLNDLCKYASFLNGRECAVFATAPSMDGYVTSTVSISSGGFKRSLPAHCPVGVFFDLEVLAASPVRMIRAGFGDTLCRSTAQLDWLLSHFLLDSPYAETPYALMREEERRLHGMADRLPRGDAEAIRLLTRLLVLSGLGVLVTRTSHCGSMGEHAISHFIDMLADPHPGTLHGEQVGLATWSMTRLQARMLAEEEPPALAPIAVEEATFRARYGRFADGCLAVMANKPFDAAATARTVRRLRIHWSELRERLSLVMLPPAEMEGLMRRAGLATSPAELGIEPAFYRLAVAHAFEIRDRYGFLDLAAQAGRLAAFAAGEG